MRKIIAAPLVAGLLGFAALAAPLAASAQTSTDPSAPPETTTTFTLVGPDGGTLAITAGTAADLTTSAAVAAGSPTVEGSLGDVTVTDNRANEVGWSTSVTSTEFVNGTYNSFKIPTSEVAYDAGEISPTGDVSVTPGSGPLDSDPLVMPAATTEATGVNSATWSPTVTVTLPSNAVAGIYTATITHSLG
jgi:hypothetical protein